MKTLQINLLTLLFSTLTYAQTTGLASRYPGDAGIDADLSVVFFDSFEDFETIDDLKTRWESISEPGIMQSDDETPPGADGNRSLLLRHVGGESTGGSLYRRFLPGYDQLYFRFYVKFSEDSSPIHHFVFAGGFNPSTPYAQGTAGKMPNGTDFFSTAAEPGGATDTWHTYTYWPGMSGAPPAGVGYGANFLADKGPPVSKGTWTCVELMMKMNALGENDGEMGIWIDGVRVVDAAPGRPKGVWTFGTFREGENEGTFWERGTPAAENYTTPEGGEPFPGFRWRTTEDLSINYLWLLAYISGSPQDHVSHIWFDNIVVATKYIGPVSTSPATDPADADFDRSGRVDFQDFLLFASHFGRRSTHPEFDARFDLNGDGRVGFTDFLRFAASFGTRLSVTARAQFHFVS